MSETGHFFLLPGGEATRTLHVGEVGGLSRVVVADEVALMGSALAAARNLLGLVLFHAAPDAFDSGVSEAGVDEGRLAARAIIEGAERALAAAGFHPNPRTAVAEEVETDPFGEEREA